MHENYQWHPYIARLKYSFDTKNDKPATGGTKTEGVDSTAQIKNKKDGIDILKCLAAN